MWIERNAENLLCKVASTRPVTVLTGARQTGKTALVRHCFPDHDYLSLDLPAIAALADEEPGSLLDGHPPPLIIDEVQYAPGLLRHLKERVDRDREKPGQYLLTGSQPFALMRGVTESLAGGAGILTLEGLSWDEARRAMPKAAIEELIWRGGFPELYAKPDIDVVRFHGDYVVTYLERDLRNDLQVGSLRDFDRFLRACAARSGGLLNMADLGRDIGVTGPTIKTWLGALERGGQLGMLEPWFDNRTTGLTKAPKPYLLDSGLACFLTAHRSPGDLDGSPLVGALWETAVYAELRKYRANTGAPQDLNFFRNRTREVDFLCQRAGRIHLAEAKWAEQPRNRDLAQLKAAREAIGADRVASCAVLCRTSTSHPLEDDIWAYAPEDVGKRWVAD